MFLLQLLDTAVCTCPMLITSGFLLFSKLGDGCLAATAAACPAIQSLVLATCHAIGPPGLLSLKKLCDLTILDLSYTFLIDLSPIFEACPHLKVLQHTWLMHSFCWAVWIKEWVFKVGIYPHQVNFSKIYILVVSLWSSAIIPNETPWSCIVGNKALVHITTISVVLRESVVLVPGPVDEISRTGKCLSMKSFQLRKGVCLAGITVVSM